MKIVLFALFLILIFLIFWGLNKVICGMSFSKNERYMHFRMVLVLFISEFVLLNHYTSSILLKALDFIINVPFISNILNFILPNRAYEVLYMLLIVIGMNLVLCIFAIIVLALIKGIFSDKNRYFLETEDYVGWKIIFLIPHKIVTAFYKPIDSKIILNEKGHCIGLWAKIMKNIFAIVAAVEIILLAVSICWGNATWNVLMRTLSKAWYWVPLAGFLLIEQIQFFLEGCIVVEASTFGSTEITETFDGDISDIPPIYNATFKNTGALICSTQLNQIERDGGFLFNDLGNQLVNDCENSDILNVLARQLNESDVVQNEIYQKALSCLVDNHSINICDKGQGEFLPYLVAYLNYVLSQGNTALILCKDREEADSYCNAVSLVMQRLNNIGAIWSICTAEAAKKDLPMNVLVCTFDDLAELRLLEKRREFSSVLKCIVIFSGEEFVAQDDIRIVRLFNEISLYTKELQYVLATNTDNDNIRTAIENLINQELLPFNNANCLNKTHVMVWEEESCHKLQLSLGLGGDMSPYIGVALPLALVAAKYDFPKVNLVPAKSRADESYYQALAVNTLESAKYLTNNADINTVIRRSETEALSPQDLKVLVCYDEYFNLLETIWEWTKYGGKNGSVLHIISPSYLLREFFIDKFMCDSSYLGNKEFDSLVPHSRTSKISNMISLLVDLRDKGLTEEEIIKRSKKYEWGYSTTEEILDSCLSVFLSSSEKYNIFEYFHFEQVKRQLTDQGGFVTETLVTLGDSETYNRIMKHIKRAVMEIGNGRSVELPILQNDIYNYYLRGQTLVYNGFLYKINAIKDGTIFANQQADCFLYDYYTVSSFSFENYTVTDKCVDKTYINFDIATANVMREVYAYWKSNNGYRITDKNVFSIESLCDDTIRESKNSIVLEMNFAKSLLGEKSKNIVNTLAFVLNEAFKTLFPKIHNNLFAVVAAERDHLDLDKIVKNGTDCGIEDTVKSLIPFTYFSNKSISDFETIYIVEFACVEYGMAKLFYEEHERIFRILREYLEWYLEPVDSETEPLAIKGNALSFAYAETPSVFALKELLDFLIKITGESVITEAVKAPDIEVNLSKECSFCGRKTLITHRFDDMRSMCNSCHDHQISQRDEIKTMFSQTVEFLENGYGIELRKNINVRFKSAKEITAEIGRISGGRVLGFYREAGHQLWLEARGPRVPMRCTLIHELTHCWQFDNLPLNKLKKVFPKKTREEIIRMLLEGHAVNVEIEAMKELHEFDYAMRQHDSYMLRDDLYGKGYRLIYNYFKKKSAEGSHMNVFTTMKCFVDDIINGKEGI